MESQIRGCGRPDQTESRAALSCSLSDYSEMLPAVLCAFPDVMHRYVKVNSLSSENKMCNRENAHAISEDKS